jgi:hypothetical protein
VRLKVISLCIFLAEGQKWPSHYRYLHGLAKNVTSFLKDYSDEWVLFVYYDDSLERLCPEEWGIAKAELEALSSVELHLFDFQGCRNTRGFHHGLIGSFARYTMCSVVVLTVGIL